MIEIISLKANCLPPETVERAPEKTPATKKPGKPECIINEQGICFVKE